MQREVKLTEMLLAVDVKRHVLGREAGFAALDLEELRAGRARGLEVIRDLDVDRERRHDGV